jgi:hypothetical protein
VKAPAVMAKATDIKVRGRGKAAFPEVEALDMAAAVVAATVAAAMEAADTEAVDTARNNTADSDKAHGAAPAAAHMETLAAA